MQEKNPWKLQKQIISIKNQYKILLPEAAPEPALETPPKPEPKRVPKLAIYSTIFNAPKANKTKNKKYPIKLREEFLNYFESEERKYKEANI